MPYTQTRWKLDALVPSAEGPEVQKALKAFERRVKKVEAWRAKLNTRSPGANPFTSEPTATTSP
jgi:hypothetical protein